MPVEVDERQIADMVQRVMLRLATIQGIAIKEPPPSFVVQPSIVAPAAVPTDARAVDGLFPDVESATAAAYLAFQQLAAMTLAKRQEIIAQMRATIKQHAEMLARLAHEETGLGRWEDKLEKNLLNATKVPGVEDVRPEVWTGDRGLTLIERAPYGLVAAITPITNPTSTIICNAIGIIAAGNAVVFNAHPGAKRCSNTTVQLLHQAIVAAGGPPNLITAVAEPTIESAQELMRHPRVRLLLVTGGIGVVREAMRSGKRAICAGPGNPPVVVDETADIDLAGRGIVKGASFDNNVVCVLEKEVFVVESVADKLKAAILAAGAIELAAHQFKRVEKVIFSEMGAPGKPGLINKDYIGKNVSVILKQIGMEVDDKTRLAVVEVERQHPLVWTEQMLPVLPLVRVRNADEAIDLAKQAEHGFGHTAVMYSRNLDNLSRMAREINTSIFVKNGPSLAGLGYGGEGFCSFSIASPTGEGLTGPRTFTRERRCTLVDHFRII